MSLESFIKNIKSDSKDIIYYGGSFYPWHEGHSECLRRAPKEMIKIVIPDHNPHKSIAERSLSIDKEYITSLNDNTYIFEGFFNQREYNPTIKWIRPISKTLSTYTHSLLLGYDSYESLYKWESYKDIIKSIDSLYILNRENKRNEVLYDVDTIFLGTHEFESLRSSDLRD